MKSYTIFKCSVLMLFVTTLGIIKADLCPKNCKPGYGCNEADGGCSECNEGWFGRKCAYPMECYRGKGFHYYGTISETVNGITCKLWTDKPPGEHSWTSLKEQRNYCRNPNPKSDDDKPWCYKSISDFGSITYEYCGTPKCITHCPPPDLLVFGDIIKPPSSGFVAGVVVEVITGGCGPGSRGKMTCQQNLTWSEASECSAIPGWCNKPVVDEPAYIVDYRNEFYYKDRTTVYCRPGYEIVGRVQITCQDDKSWGYIPQCTRVNCDKPTLNRNSNISVNDKRIYQYEDEITFACDTGYDIIGQTTLTCLADRQWNGNSPSCKVVECSQPNLKENSYIVNNKTTYIYRDTIALTCLNGYTIKGTRSFKCGADKSWNGKFPSCEPVPCNEPSLPLNTNLKSPRNFYVYKDEISLTCVKGYELKDKDTISCLANGSWSILPECTAVPCNEPSLPLNTNLKSPRNFYVYKDEISLTCVKGYELKDKDTISCLANGSWSILPECTAVPCNEPSLPLNTNLKSPRNFYVYKDEISLTCVKGYELKDKDTISCLANGSWSILPECTAVPCNKPSLPLNTNLKSPRNFYVYKDEISLTCVKGYELKDKDTISCLANGSWSILPECTAVKCKDPELPTNFMILQGNNTVYQYLDIVTLGCKENYEFNGTNTTTCLHTGRWQQLVAECIAYPAIQHSEETSTDVTPIAVGVIGALVVTGIVAVIIFIFLRKLKKYGNKSGNEESQLRASQEMKSQPSARHIYANTAAGPSGNEYANFSAINEEKVIEDNIYSDPGPDTTDKSVTMEDFADYVRERNSTDFFDIEFSKFKTGLQRSANEACKQKNKPKNKYRNIYPYDDNRVILQKIPSIPDSDYINASPIKGYDGKTKYIAAQGPQKATVTDFWRMIWEQNCGRIVMLTNVFEEGKQKCEYYWPDKGTVQMGTITIEHINTDVYADFTVRQLAISKGGARRILHHFHFTAWPDKSVPSYVYLLAQFHRKVFLTPCYVNGPLVVHCSAGIGRTGTFIALDYLNDEANSVGSVRVFSCLERLRDQRVNMLQTKEQYAFLHRVLLEDYECEVSKVRSSEFISRYKQLQREDLVTGRTLLDNRYQALKKSSPVVPMEEFVGSKRPAVKNKNRYNNILPVDSYRPFLTGSGEESGDYINAVYLPSYRDKTAFIATQMPLPNTVVDFWTLVYEQNVSAVVMLNQTIDKSCGVYWCGDGNTDKTFGPFTVSLIKVQRDDEVVVRTLKIQRQSDQPRTVKQFTLTDWPDSAAVPASPSSLLHLMNKVQTCQSGKQGTPVVVHCMNGADKSGLFCTVVAIIDRLTVEQDVVIHQIITQMQNRRPQCIPNKEQFQFCYEAVNEYLQRFETYSNFA